MSEERVFSRLKTYRIMTHEAGVDMECLCRCTELSYRAPRRSRPARFIVRYVLGRADRMVEVLARPDLRRQALEWNRELVGRRGLLEENMARMEELYRGLAGRRDAASR